MWTDPDNNIHKQLNVQQVAWCSDWPSGSTFIPALFETGQEYNTGGFSEPSVDEAISEVSSLPGRGPAGRVAELDRTIMQDFFP